MQMNNFKTTTLYSFFERDTEIIITETTDVRIIDLLADGNAIEQDGFVKLKGNKYKITHIAIVPQGINGNPVSRNRDETEGEVNEFNVHVQIFVIKND